MAKRRRFPSDSAPLSGGSFFPKAEESPARPKTGELPPHLGALLHDVRNLPEFALRERFAPSRDAVRLEPGLGQERRHVSPDLLPSRCAIGLVNVGETPAGNESRQKILGPIQPATALRLTEFDRAGPASTCSNWTSSVPIERRPPVAASASTRSERANLSGRRPTDQNELDERDSMFQSCSGNRNWKVRKLGLKARLRTASTSMSGGRGRRNFRGASAWTGGRLRRSRAARSGRRSPACRIYPPPLPKALSAVRRIGLPGNRRFDQAGY